MVTDVRFLKSVNALVVGQATPTREGRPTVLAYIRLLARVNAVVHVQVA